MSNKEYYREIDSLRAIAVIAVIINHLNKDWLPGGFLGVDIFFVISGFVVTASLQGKENLPFKDFIKGFYSRRIKRIWPSLAFMALIFIIPVFFFFGYPGHYVKTALYSLLGVSNIFLFNHSSDYFSVSAETNPFTHTWSLGVEEQFYLFFPLLYFLGTKKKIFIPLLILLSVTSLGLFIYLNKDHHLFTFYMMPMRLWQFVLGAMSFIGSFRKMPKNLMVVSLLGMFSCLIFTSEFNYYSAVSVTLLTGLILGVIKETSERKYLTLKPMLKIGLMSYSLYLFHWPVIVFFKELMTLEGGYLWAALTIMILLSVLSYEKIESTLRKKTWKRWDYITCVGVILVVFLFMDQRFVITKKLFLNDSGIGYSLYNDPKYDAHFRKCYDNASNDFVHNTVDKFRERLRACDLISRGEKTIYMFGNSYAEQIAPLILKLSEQYHYKFLFYAKGGIKIYPFGVDHQKGKEISKELSALFFESVKSLSKPGDIVILSTPILFGLTSNFRNQNDHLISNEKAFGFFTEYLKNKIEEFKTIGVDVYFVSGFPLLKREIQPKNCLKNSRKCIYPNLIDVESTNHVALLDGILKEKLGKNYISLFNTISDELKNSEKPWALYFNNSHLSSFANKKSYPTLEREIFGGNH